MKEVEFNRNNFDIIRLFAALQVVLFHGLSHLKLDMPFLNFLRIFPGVFIFFVISGFLISASYQRSRSLASYYKNRFLRIYPGLWVCLIVSIFTAKIFGGVDFMSWQGFLWEIAQCTIGQFYNPDFLRGYGVGTLNGSLWTIPVELQFYILLPGIYFLLRKLQLNMVLKLVLFAVTIGMYQFYILLGGGPEKTMAYKLLCATIFPHLFCFMMGVILQVKFSDIKHFIVDKFLVWLFIYVVWVIGANFFGITTTGNHLSFVSALILALLILSAAYTRTDLGLFLYKKDFSYGIYIYHMVVFNILVTCHWVESYVYLGLGIVMTFILAILSWYFVEKPALKLKSYSILKDVQKLQGEPS